MLLFIKQWIYGGERMSQDSISQFLDKQIRYMSMNQIADELKLGKSTVMCSLRKMYKRNEIKMIQVYGKGKHRVRLYKHL